jgi:CspA family cold shock protein
MRVRRLTCGKKQGHLVQHRWNIRRSLCVIALQPATIFIRRVHSAMVVGRPNSEIQLGNALMPEGIIKKLTDKGFGFIKTDTGKDLFFHSKSLQGVEFDDLQEGQKVTYTQGQGPKGPCAENVKLA